MTTAGLLVLAFLALCGRFLPATLSWGFHHFAYLPLGAWLAGWALAALAIAVLLSPAMLRKVTTWLDGPVANLLFAGSRRRALLLGAAATGLFVLARTATHLLGDGVLVAELVGRGAEFRAHDAMDYQLHLGIHRALGNVGDNAASFRLYAITSWVAGFLAILTALLLMRRSRLSNETRTQIFLLWFLSAPILLYCGYVESYGFLSVALLGFFWSGAMAQRGEIRAWVPGLFYGAAFFFHSTALFAGPALLWLALRPGPGRAPRGRWRAQVLLPSLAGPLLAAGLHLALGYDEAWFRKEFLESKNQRTVLIGLGGAHGLFSWAHWKDLANWVLLVIPVTGWLIVSKLGAIRSRFREPDIAFLTVHALAFLLPFLFLDRKLGAARDWDLLAPQVAGLAYLAARLHETPGERQPRGKAPVALRVAAPVIALLLLAPWIAVNASRDRALQRFDEIRADFPRHPRAYAAEELGKHFRDRGEIERALGYYQESVAIFPRNARTRILLGTNYLMLERTDEASAQYDTALAIDPNNWLALDVKSKLALHLQDFETALPLCRKMTAMRPGDRDAWIGVGSAAYRLGRHAEALEAFLKAARLAPEPRLYYFAGLSAGFLQRWDEAIQHLAIARREGGESVEVLYALAVAHQSRYETGRRSGTAGDPRDLRAAREFASRALALDPKDAELRRYFEFLDGALRGVGAGPEEEGR